MYEQKKENEKEKGQKRELTQGNKKEKRKKSNGGSKANFHRSLQNYGDLKWRFTGKSSKFDLPINKSTYKYINLSYLVDYVLKKQNLIDNLIENKLSGNQRLKRFKCGRKSKKRGEVKEK